MRALLGVSRAIDAVTGWLGRWVAWCIVAAVLISAGNAIIRKLFDSSSNAWLEMQWWLFGIVFLLCAPWTLSSNEHIRIDIVNSMFPKWLKHTVEVVGHVFFLMPIAIVMIYTSVPFFLSSYYLNEQSTNAGGLPQWPAKFLVPLGFALLLIQGISELIKRLAIITGDLQETASGGGHHAAAEAEAKRLQEALEEEARKRAGATA